MSRDYIENLFLEILSKNPRIVQYLKLKEDENKIYTCLGYINKNELEDSENE